MAADVSELIMKRTLGESTPSSGSEGDDVRVGDEPGAGKGTMLVPTDSYEDIAAFLEPSVGSLSMNDHGAQHHHHKGRDRAGSEGRKKSVEKKVEEEYVDEEGEGEENHDDSSSRGEETDSIDSIVERVDANIHRNDTINSIDIEQDEDETDHNNSFKLREAMPPDDAIEIVTPPTSPARTLSLQTQGSISSDGGGADAESCVKESWRRHRKHIFILSSAGKPIYTRYGDETDQASIIGVLQALFMSYQHSEDRRDSLMSINAGPHRFVFLYREPLILVAVSRGDGGESQHQLKHQLLYAYYQIVFVLTAKRIDAYFKDRTNYDLRRQLTGVDRFTDSLMQLCDTDASVLLGAVRCLAFDGVVRDVVAQVMLQHCKVKDLVFAILFADGQLVTIVRHRNYYLHPIELHLIFNLVGVTDSFKGAENWVPVCLPKFDPRGFLYAYISYLDDACDACLVMLTVDSGDFATLSKARSGVQHKLKQQKCLDVIGEAVKRKAYTTRSVGIPELRHFLYKSKSASLCTSPQYDVPYDTLEEQERLMALYRHVHHRTHSVPSHGSAPLRMYFIRGMSETCIGWMTSGFEVYAVFGPLISKQDAITGVNKLLRWIKKEEDKLFILNSLTIPPL